ncbi:uvrD/REP helicase N-terminal domain protein [Mycobacterium avium subsp. avium 2285 (R)]|nr:uvrD/REP helicase N-terminal domain protein [Mycobacterium avium subsp. avium 2285 (R)]
MSDRYSPRELACALGLFPPTEEQAAVIAAPPGPLVVIAGAGAGKTETMAARVVWLIANGYAHPGQVLGLTFTRKAAGQLLRRVRSRLARLAGVGLGRRARTTVPSTPKPPRWSAPITPSPARCCATTACCCRSSRTPGCSAKPSCGSWLLTW